MTTLTTLPLVQASQHLEVLFQKMQTAWESLGYTNSLYDDLVKKKPSIEQEKTKGILVYDNKEGKEIPCGIGILEYSNKKYGTLILYCTEPEYRKPLVDALVASNELIGGCVELIQLENTFEYRDHFIEHDYFEKERQRMIFEFNDPFPKPEPKGSVQFEPLTLENCVTVGEVSNAAHNRRREIEGYYDFSTPELRANMARQMRENKFGNEAEGLCLLMHYNNEPAGICDVVDSKIWQYNKIAWIMDITIHPSFQGMGLGLYLLQHVMHTAYEQNFPAIGLAVTLSNTNALKLYEDMNFEQREFFVEIISKKWESHAV
jgi:ribosomal protein S18 acetylase RimI-like enzyme